MGTVWMAWCGLVAVTLPLIESLEPSQPLNHFITCSIDILRKQTIFHNNAIFWTHVWIHCVKDLETPWRSSWKVPQNLELQKSLTDH